jgi:hypothetical protein
MSKCRSIAPAREQTQIPQRARLGSETVSSITAP